jgi:hypothetical protein
MKSALTVVAPAGERGTRARSLATLATAWWLLLAAVWGFVGVAPHLPPFHQHALVVQLHAAGFGLWTVLVVVQVHLARTGSRRLHRLCGTLALAACVVGVLAGLGTIGRAVALDRRTPFEGLSLLIPILVGSLMVVHALANRRRDPASHARSMLLATASFTTLAIDRIGFLMGLHAFPWLIVLLRIAPVTAIGVIELNERSRPSWRVALTSLALLAVDAPSLVGAG